MKLSVDSTLGKELRLAQQIKDKVLIDNKASLIGCVEDLALQLARAELRHSASIVRMGQEHENVVEIHKATIRQLEADVKTLSQAKEFDIRAISVN